MNTDTTNPQCDTSSHARRNLTKEIIPPNNKARVSKASSAVRQDLTKEKQAALQADIEHFLEQQNTKYQIIAEAHGKKVEYIRDLLTNASHFTHVRSTNRYNALVHYKSHELNKDRAAGERVPLREIHLAIKNDPELQNLSEERNQEIIKQLNEYKSMKSVGARSSNRAATLDYRNIAIRLQSEFENLTERTGVIGFAFFARGHVNDTMLPGWFGSGNSLDFLSEVLNMPASELSRKFELWSITQNRTDDSPTKPKTLLETQKECTRMIRHGLNVILGVTQASMEYSTYDRDIRARHQVELVGWPSNVKFISPSSITVRADVRMLYDALQCGECHWVLMADEAVAALNEHLQGVPAKRRAQRSDAGTTRGPGKGTAQRGGAQKGKGAKRIRTGPATQVPPDVQKYRIC